MSDGITDTAREHMKEETAKVVVEAGAEEATEMSKEEMMKKEAAQAKVLLAADGLHMEEEDILKILLEVDVECTAIVDAITPWTLFISDKEIMNSIMNTECIDMQECVQRVSELKQIQQHLLITAAWMMKLKIQTQATPKIITPNAGDGKIIGLDGRPVE